MRYLPKIANTLVREEPFSDGPNNFLVEGMDALTLCELAVAWVDEVPDL